jgi:hypothetical protein
LLPSLLDRPLLLLLLLAPALQACYCWQRLMLRACCLQQGPA